MIDKLTIYFPYYNQSDALINQLEIMSNYNENIRKRLCVFIVDDGSQKDSALPIIEKKYLDKLDITLYRIDIDIPWNMPEANNLAFREINTDYIIRLDIDHFFCEDSIKDILSLDITNNTCYKFTRKQFQTKNILGSHPNSYLISKKDYLKIGGYNEYFSGNRGYDDIEFLPRLRRIVEVKLLDICIFVNGDYLTRGLNRDLTINFKKLKETNIPHLTFVNSKKYIKQL